MQAEVIAVGAELLSFGRIETNSLFLASRLSTLGLPLVRKTVVGDVESSIISSLQGALQTSRVILLTGGLGPTNDDVTREVVARFLELPLEEDPAVIEDLRRRYQRFGLQLSPNNRKQARVPRGATVLPNPKGTAPGLMIETKDQRLLFLLPGPPRELHPMVDNHVVPTLKSKLEVTTVPLRHLKVAGESESSLDARIEPIYLEYEEIATTILSSPGVISIYLLWQGGPDREEAEEKLSELNRRLGEELGSAVFTEEEKDLPEVLGEELRTRRLTLAAAESCTGGWIGKLLTDIAGSSDYFLGSAVCYSDEAKRRLLSVPQEILDEHGAVSRETAELMAKGARRSYGSDIGLSVTGIAGPGGGSDEKPVGTVYLGLVHEEDTWTRRLNLPGDRDLIRLRTANLALDWVRRKVCR